jgi:hypothetical protein
MAKKPASSSAATFGGCATCSGCMGQLRVLSVWHATAQRAVDSPDMRLGAGWVTLRNACLFSHIGDLSAGQMWIVLAWTCGISLDVLQVGDSELSGDKR